MTQPSQVANWARSGIAHDACAGRGQRADLAGAQGGQLRSCGDDGWATPVDLGQPPEIRRVGAERGQQPVDEGCIRLAQQRIVGLPPRRPSAPSPTAMKPSERSGSPMNGWSTPARRRSSSSCDSCVRPSGVILFETSLQATHLGRHLLSRFRAHHERYKDLADAMTGEVDTGTRTTATPGRNVGNVAMCVPPRRRGPDMVAAAPLRSPRSTFRFGADRDRHSRRRHPDFSRDGQQLALDQRASDEAVPVIEREQLSMTGMVVRRRDISMPETEDRG